MGEAVRLLQRIVDENPGRQMAGAARLELAYLRELLQNRQEAIRIAEEVRSEFRDTPAGIQAEKYLICMRYSGRERRVRLDALIAYIGGVPVNQVLRYEREKDQKPNAIEVEDCDNPGLSFRPVCFLSSEMQRHFLQELYVEVAYLLDNLAMYKECPPRLDREKSDEVIRLLHFMRERFFDLQGDCEFNVAFLQRCHFFGRRGVFDYSMFPRDETPPRIHVISPRSGQLVGVRRPMIVVTLDDGDIRELQINTTSLRVTLDGCDITSQACLRTSYDTSGSFDVVFEKMRLTFRPRHDLAPGRHKIWVRVLDRALNGAEATSFFTIDGPPGATLRRRGR